MMPAGDREALIRERDRATAELWFTGPASFTAQAARDRRELLGIIDSLMGEWPEPAKQTGAWILRLRELTALQATDEALWAGGVHIETAYVQQALRYLTRAIEGEWTIEAARESIMEMMP